MMLREKIGLLVNDAARKLATAGFLGSADIDKIIGPGTVSACKDAAHGDYASNIAMRLAGAAKKPPLEIAQKNRRRAESKQKSGQNF